MRLRKEIIILLIFLSLIAKSQDITGNFSFNQIANLKAPQTSDFTRYGNLPITKFVGLPAVEIPLFNVKSNQLGDNIAISLAYNFSGFVPNKRPDIVGLNWFLNIGGLITREVKSIPDDQKGASNMSGAPYGMSKDGLIIGLKNKKNTCPPLHSNIGILNLTTSTGLFNSMDDYQLRGCDIYTGYDPDPDVFSFNFNGYSGRFFLGNDNQIKIISDNANGFKIDIENVGIQPLSNICKPVFSEIKITDNKGNAYFFGGETRNLEYTISVSTPSDAGHSSPTGLPVINSWFLRQITYANGEILRFNYYDDSPSILIDNFCYAEHYEKHTNPESKKFILFNESILESASCNSYTDNTDPNAIYNCIFSGNTTGKVYSLTKKAVLANITGSDFKVVLNYADQPYIFNNNYYNDNSVYKKLKNQQLNSIVLYNKGLSEVNRFDFTYDLLGGTTELNSYPRLFLKTLQEKSKEPYAFNYNINPGEVLPTPATRQLDHWGFYNGKNVNDSTFGWLIPTHSFTPEDDYIFTSDTRDPDFNYSVKGVLQEITYPTKGTTSFQFEAPYYSKRMERRSQNGFMPALYNATGDAGGIRIQSIKDIDENKNSNERLFNYEDGILLNWPRYIMWVHNNVQSRGWLQSSSINSNIFESSIINYGKVTETIINKGKTVSEFSNYSTHPDNSDYNVIINSSNPLSHSTNLELAKNYIGLFYNDISNERGRLLNEVLYNSADKPVKRTAYTYNNLPSRFNLYSSIIHTTGPAAQSNKKYFYQNKMSQKDTYDYLYQNNVQKIVKTSEYFNYNDDPDFQMISKKTVSPDMHVSETLFTYAHQENNQYLVSKNIIGIPLGTEVKKDNVLISKSKVQYPSDLTDANNFTSGLPLPKSVLSYETENLNNPSVPNPIPTTNIIYKEYDSKGNLLQYILKPDIHGNGTPVAIIWGYNQTQPIAKIEGAKLSDIQQASINEIIDASNLDASDPTKEKDFINALDSFRKDLLHKGYQISTYTYDPLVGITSITSSSGIREYYFYDDANRLEYVKSKDENGNFNIIKEYKHHYKTTYHYNEEQSETFTRNDCPFGTLPGNVLYTVPKNTYSSTINIEDANHKAKNDIAANGQNFANTTATCTPYDCKVTSSVSGIVTVDKSSFKETALNHITGMLEISITEPGTTIWLHGANVGVLDGLCRPSSLKIIQFTDDSGALWRIKVFPDGNISLTSADNQAELVTLTFEYDKN